MEAKDTVIHSDDCEWHGYMTSGSLGDTKVHYKCTCGREAQAEISFKAGQTWGIQCEKSYRHDDYRAGIREVVGWMRNHGGCLDGHYGEWRAKLKEWGIG